MDDSRARHVLDAHANYGGLVFYWCVIRTFVHTYKADRTIETNTVMSLTNTCERICTSIPTHFTQLVSARIELCR